jgi:hypothetical protein
MNANSADGPALRVDNSDADTRMTNALTGA